MDEVSMEDGIENNKIIILKKNNVKNKIPLKQTILTEKHRNIEFPEIR